jgi:hypothetical protein
MFKIVCFLKRKPGISREEFIKYYESNHRLIGERSCSNWRRYVRRYLAPLPDVVTGEAGTFEYDVVTEMWFDDRAGYDSAVRELSKPEISAVIAADEENLFDRGKNRLFCVEEYESVKP